jgi:hypothetical protein
MEKFIKRSEIAVCLVIAMFAILLSICSFAGLVMTGGWWLLIMGGASLALAVAMIKESFKLTMQ